MVTDPHPYNPCGDHLGLDFVNSIGRSPTTTGTERLVDYAALNRWSLQAGSITPQQSRALERAAGARPGAARAVLTRARALREAIFDVFEADVHGLPAPEPALETINTELARALARSRLRAVDGAFEWTWCDAEVRLDAPLWPIARATAELLVSPDREQVKECASDDCVWLFLDRTRNHRRRWCEMKGCGNRAKVREHRARRRKAQRRR